ncbi:MAG TPA: hypothetical protein IAB98_05075 [Candidatus Egerieimonas intestinavium]|uniref:Uncharacterized protein n=1 Tax=Candidatus Egerieimonas intestinavium TaxID=2840777 RepID=A0A9D1JFB5_9FIRM|nr:hypothetical protein [Candidatus Egerieimonas intestinavium]
MSETEMFKTTLMGGYDKDDVQMQVQALKEEAYAEKSRLLKEIKEKDSKISELLQRLDAKEQQIEKYKKDISEKYQQYIDNYESIGRLVYESQVRADNMIKEAEKKRDELLAEATVEAERRVLSVQTEIDEKLAEGKKKYIAVQDEMNDIVELINQAQQRFMSSYKEVHRIISSMPESMQELGDEQDEAAEEMEEQVEDSLDEADTDEVEADIMALLSQEEED